MKHIVKLEIENVKRVRCAVIEPHGNRVILSGKNGNGKTSVLDAIEMAIGGASSIPQVPIRIGARKGYVVVDLGDLVVERTFTSKGTQLEVRDKDGKSLPSPQTGILDRLCGRLCLDPLSFARDKPAEQDAQLKKLLGLDFSEWDADEARLYEERKGLNKQVKEKEAQFKAMPRHPGVPKEEVSVAALAQELATAQEHAHARRNAEDAVTRQTGEVERALNEVERIKVMLRDAEDKYRTATAGLDASREALAALAPNQDTSELQAKISTAEETNRKVRENKARDEMERTIAELEKKSERCSEAIEVIKGKKKDALAAADFPVPGLGFDDVGPTLDGIPLEQCSQADKIKLSAAITMKQNPELRILLLRQAESLDDDSWAFLQKLADEHDFQIWVEVVKSDDPSALVLSDGEILEQAAPAAE